VQNSKDPQIHESKRTKPINFQSTAEHINLESIVDGSWSLHSLRPAKQFFFFPGIFFCSQRDGHHHVIRIEKLALRIQIQKQTNKQKLKKILKKKKFKNTHTHTHTHTKHKTKRREAAAAASRNSCGECKQASKVHDD